MRHGLTSLAGFVLALLLIGAGAGPDPSPGNEASPLDDRFGIRTAPIYLLMRPDVQRDMQLNPQQIAGARELIGRLIERLLKLKNKKGPGVLEERQAIDDEMARWFVDALSDTQRLRLRQIDLQWEGTSALCRMSVAGYLDMSEQQRSTVERLLTEREKRRAKGLLAPGDSETFARQMLSVLTPSQRVHWDGLLGPPCRFTIGHPAAPRSRAGDPGLTGQPQPPTR